MALKSKKNLKKPTKNSPKLKTNHWSNQAPKKEPKGLPRGIRGGQKKPFSALKFIRYSIIGIAWICVFIFILLVYYCYDIPDVRFLQVASRRPNIQILDNNHQLIGTVGEFSSDLHISALPSYVPAAFVAIEDRRFFSHSGVDFIGILRALFNNLRSDSHLQGASTISQQLAKNLFLNSTRSIRRKIQELLLSLWLEHKFTKQQILQIYLNRVYLGGGNYGINAAAYYYFRKPATRLTLPEAALLAGMIKAPSHYSPFYQPLRSQARGQLVLDAMQQCGFIAHNKIMPPIAEIICERHQQLARMKHFVDWIEKQAIKLLGAIEEDIIITTTLDPKWQRRAQESVAATMSSDSMQNIVHNLAHKNKSFSPLSIAVISVDNSGAIKAMIGGENYERQQFNCAVQSYRQIGSIFKLFVYMCAAEAKIPLNYQLTDQPLNFKDWAPKDYKWKKRGSITLQDAFAYSINTATIRLARQIGVRKIINMAKRLGLSQPQPNDLSVCLGTGSASLMELAAAYATVSNAGIKIEPYAIKEIKNRQGKVLYRYAPPPKVRLFEPYAAEYGKQLLRAATNYGTAKRLKSQHPNEVILGKTGTSTHAQNAYFIGSHNNVTTAVRVSHDNKYDIPQLAGGSFPMLIWSRMCG